MDLIDPLLFYTELALSDFVICMKHLHFKCAMIWLQLGNKRQKGAGLSPAGFKCEVATLTYKCKQLSAALQ